MLQHKITPIKERYTQTLNAINCIHTNWFCMLSEHVSRNILLGNDSAKTETEKKCDEMKDDQSISSLFLPSTLSFSASTSLHIV